MKLRNKKTGEIIDVLVATIEYQDNCQGQPVYNFYDSLAELNEWEDVPEEPKEYWYISDFGYVFNHEINNKSVKLTIEEMKSIGNYFLSREEAEKAVEKLKAVKRLNDKGFRFIGKTYETDKRFGSIFYKVDDDTYSEDIVDDLDLLFSGGEE